MYLHANFEFIMILNILVGNLEDEYIQPMYVY